ncbi:MAG: His/Gly/Thr/Pro-type tRNA ligase C-terminal domain-containing protein, partial [Actinomycetota bacterium]
DGDRENSTAALRTYFESYADALSPESLATLARNPLRVLDSKRVEDQAIISTAPRITEFLSADASRHFETVLAALESLGVKFALEDRLVRGLDYYRRTTFEFVSAALQSAHTAIGGGGRYNGLVEALGGPATPGIGFALGLDRTLLACDAEGVFAAPKSVVSVFVVDTTGGMQAAQVCNELRAAGISADRAFDDRSMKAQMKVADRSGSPIAIIIGTDEVTANGVVLRRMTSGEQRVVSRSALLDEIRKELL